MSRFPRTKLLKPSAQQAMLFRRLAYLERTIGPLVKAQWNIIPTPRERADSARAHIEDMYRRRGKRFSKASCNTQSSTGRPESLSNGLLEFIAGNEVYDMQSQLIEIVAAKQAAKERGEFRVVEPIRDKFPQAFKDAITALAESKANPKAK